MTSKSGVRREATCTARMTRLAMVPPSLYAGKKKLTPGGREGSAGFTSARNRSAERICATRTSADGPPCREAPRQHHRFEHDPPGELRDPLAPLDECDRHFHDAAA